MFYSSGDNHDHTDRPNKFSVITRTITLSKSGNENISSIDGQLDYHLTYLSITLTSSYNMFCLSKHRVGG